MRKMDWYGEMWWNEGNNGEGGRAHGRFSLRRLSRTRRYSRSRHRIRER